MSDRAGVQRPLRAEKRPSYRPEVRAGFDPGMWRIGVLAACGGGVVALVAGAVSLVGNRPHQLPVIEAEAGPVRIKPIDPGGMTASGAELNTPKGEGQAMAPPAEQPAIAALREQLRAAKKLLAHKAAETAQAEKVAAEAKLAARQQVAGGVVPSPGATQASATLRIAAIPPILRPPMAPVPADSIAAALSPGVRVQLAAFTDASAAHGEWETLRKKMPDLLGGRHAEISQVVVAGRTMWRLRTGPFAGTAEATGFCMSLRARGADCSVAAF